MTDPMKTINLDRIIADSGVTDTPELRELLGQAYDIGGLEAAAAPLAPGDPAAAERQLDALAVAATLLLRNPALGRPTVESVLAEIHTRKG